MLGVLGQEQQHLVVEVTLEVKAPRTAAGQPDLQGVWANNSATPLQRLTEFDGRAHPTDEEVVRLQKRANDIFSSGAAQRRFAANARVVVVSRADGPEDRPLSEPCITFGIPDTLAGYNSYYQVVQTPTVIAIITERIHDTRLIRLDGSPRPPPGVRLWLGDSRGHWTATRWSSTRRFSRPNPA